MRDRNDKGQLAVPVVTFLQFTVILRVISTDTRVPVEALIATVKQSYDALRARGRRHTDWVSSPKHSEASGQREGSDPSAEKVISASEAGQTAPEPSVVKAAARE
mmetsp:Transcript_132339/g.229473  ORF Transcript_132339/g.229473 Transcript_132339/m.229473 type:complete len:105 (+) Transcript_132339:550-864(+)